MTAKQAARKVIEELPANASWQELQYRLYVRQLAEQGLADYKAGRVISHEDFERKASRWFGKSSGR